MIFIVFEICRRWVFRDLKQSCLLNEWVIDILSSPIRMYSPILSFTDLLKSSFPIVAEWHFLPECFVPRFHGHLPVFEIELFLDRILHAGQFFDSSIFVLDIHRIIIEVRGFYDLWSTRNLKKSVYSTLLCSNSYKKTLSIEGNTTNTWEPDFLRFWTAVNQHCQKNCIRDDDESFHIRLFYNHL